MSRFEHKLLFIYKCMKETFVPYFLNTGFINYFIDILLITKLIFYKSVSFILKVVEILCITRDYAEKCCNNS